MSGKKTVNKLQLKKKTREVALREQAGWMMNIHVRQDLGDGNAQ
jgi:hypothetical protein